MVPSAHIWLDVANIVDVALLVGSVSLLHMWVNVHLTPEGTQGTNDCPQWQGWFAGVLAVPCVLSVVQIVVRARLYWVSWFRPPEPMYRSLGASFGANVPPKQFALRERWYMIMEVAFGVLAICAGAVMQVVAKPESWGVAAYMEGCTMFDSPPSLLLWLVGELASFGYGVRLALVAWSEVSVHTTFGAAVVLFLMLAAAVGIGAGAHVVVTPWLVTVMNDLAQLEQAETASLAFSVLGDAGAT